MGGELLFASGRCRHERLRGTSLLDLVENRQFGRLKPLTTSHGRKTIVGFVARFERNVPVFYDFKFWPRHHSQSDIGFACLMLVLLTGCGGGNQDGGNFDGLYEKTNSDSSESSTGTGISTSSDSGKLVLDASELSNVVRQATQHLNGMSAEYEGFFGSGQSSVQLKRTEQLYQLIDPLSRRITTAPAPIIANKLKQDVLPNLLDAIKRAEIAGLHFKREYNTSSFGFSGFSKGGHEIEDGIRAARHVLDRIQLNIPVAERLTTGPPPTIGGPPPTNRSFGYLRSLPLDGSQSGRFRTSNSDDMVPWRLTIDSPAHPYRIKEESEFEIDAPSADAKPSAFYNPLNVLYPAMPSTVVGLGLNESKGQKRQIWSLEPRLRSGVVKQIQLQKSDIMALSPDGKYFAARPEGTSIIGLFDVKKSEAIGQVEHEFATGKVATLLFAADNRLVLIYSNSVYVWSVPDLKLERTLELESTVLNSVWNPGYSWSISPGGRYLSIPQRGSVKFYDLTTGAAAAKISFSGFRSSSYVASSFSKDGTKLAILANGPWNTWVQVWGITSGRLIASYTKEGNLSGVIDGDRDYQGPSIDWFPDGRRVLLYGKGIFDIETGQGTRLITSTVRYRVKPIGGDKIAVLQNKQYVAFDLNEIPQNLTRWDTEALKSETTDADNPFAIVQEGGKPAPLSVDRSSVRYISRQTNPNWSVTADPSSAPSVSESIVIPEFSNGHLYHTSVAANQSKFVAGYTSAEPRIWAGKVSDLDTMKAWVEYLDLKNPARPEKFDFSFACGFQAVSPSGSRVLTRDFDGVNRFDVWDLEAKKHLAGFIPYAQGRDDGGAPIRWSDFIDDERVLTVAAGQLTCWSVPEGKALYEVELSLPSILPVFSPARKYLVIANGNALSVISTETGEIVGYQDQLGLGGPLTAVAFRADGQELAVLSSPPGGGELAIIGIESGQVEESFPLPLTGKTLQWCNDDFMLIDGGYCISLEKHAVAWIYNLDGVRVQSGPGEVQLFLSKSAYKSPHTLISAKLPTPQALSALKKSDPPNDVVLSVGGSIALDIQIPSPPGHGNFSEEVRSAFENQFSIHEISVTPSAALTLVVRGNQDKTGNGISLSRFGSAFNSRTDLDEERVTWTLSVRQGNQTLWQRSISSRNTGSINLDEGVTGQAAINQAAGQLKEQMWKNAASRLLNFKVPKYVFGPQAGSGLGSTMLGGGD